MHRKQVDGIGVAVTGLGLIAAYFALVCVLILGWVMNVVAFASCDFEPSYKAEIIRGVGIVVAPVGAISGYLTIEDGVTEEVEAE